MRRCGLLALLLACAPARQVAVAPDGAAGPVVTATVVPSPTVDAAAAPTPVAAGPVTCPEPHVGARLQVGPDLRAERVAAWHGVPTLRLARGDYPKLSGSATGLLFSVAYVNGDDCHTAAPGAADGYAFSADRGATHAPYFTSQGEGTNFIDDWQVPLPDGSIARYDAAMIGPQSGASRCLHACAHLATVEVNGGRGNRGLHFVVTAVEPVDGAHPLAVEAVLDDLRARFADTWRGEEAELQRRYAEVLRTLPVVPLDARVDRKIHVEPMWIADAAELEVIVWRDARATGERRTGRETVPPTNCPDGAPCAYRESGTFDLFEVVTIDSELAAVYRVDRRGVLVQETVYAPRVQGSSRDDRRRR